MNMRRLLYTLIAIASIIACTPQKNNEVKKELPIVEFVDSFKSQHPDWSNNSITKENANNDYLKMIEDTTLLFSLTEGIKVKFSELSKTKDGKYMGHFYAWMSQPNIEEHRISKVMFDVVTCIDDSLATKLVEKEEYMCKWKMISRVNYETFCFLLGLETSTIQATPQIEIDDMDHIDISLGLFYGDLIEIEGLKK